MKGSMHIEALEDGVISVKTQLTHVCKLDKAQIINSVFRALEVTSLDAKAELVAIGEVFHMGTKREDNEDDNTADDSEDWAKDEKPETAPVSEHKISIDINLNK